MSERGAAATPAPPRSLRLSIRLATGMAVLLVLTGATIIAVNDRNSRADALSFADELIGQLVDRVTEKLHGHLAPAEGAAAMATHLVASGALDLGDLASLEPFAEGVLRGTPQIDAFFVADAAGDYVAARRRPEGRIETERITPTDAEPLEPGSGRPAFDPRETPWYRNAQAASRGQVTWTDVFFAHEAAGLGIVASSPIHDAEKNVVGAFGVEVDMDHVSAFLAEERIGRTGFALVLDHRERVIARPTDAERSVAERRRPGSEPSRAASGGNLEDPVILAALAAHRAEARPRFVYEHDGVRRLAAIHPLREIGEGWLVIVIVPEVEILGRILESTHVAIVLSLGMLVLGVFGAAVFGRRVAQPIERLTRATERIERFELDEPIDVTSSITEVQKMAAAIQKMQVGLRSFERYVPAELVRQLIDRGESAKLGGEPRELTILFSDIAGFSTISERLPPDVLTLRLTEYFDELGAIVLATGGTLDKFIGDAIMAFWGAPIPEPEHARLACQTALRCREANERLNERWLAEGRDVAFTTRFGIHTGPTIVGNLGARERLSYTVIGDSVNLASRLEGVNKVYGTHLLISEATHAAVGDAFLVRPLDVVAVKGKVEGVAIFELVAERAGPAPSADRVRLLEGFTDAYGAYRRRDWPAARDAFAALHREFPDDPPTTLYVERLDEFLAAPPADDWDGIVRLRTK